MKLVQRGLFAQKKSHKWNKRAQNLHIANMYDFFLKNHSNKICIRRGLPLVKNVLRYLLGNFLRSLCDIMWKCLENVQIYFCLKQLKIKLKPDLFWKLTTEHYKTRFQKCLDPIMSVIDQLYLATCNLQSCCWDHYKFLISPEHC